MPIKHLLLINIILCVALISICFTDWSYYPDINETFSGAYSKDNIYGKPYKLFVILSIINIILTTLGKYFVAVYTKLFIVAILLAYAVKNFIDFSHCRYFVDCPERKLGLYLMLLFSILIFIAAFFKPKISKIPKQK